MDYINNKKAQKNIILLKMQRQIEIISEFLKQKPKEKNAEITRDELIQYLKPLLKLNEEVQKLDNEIKELEM